VVFRSHSLAQSIAPPKIAASNIDTSCRIISGGEHQDKCQRDDREQKSPKGEDIEWEDGAEEDMQSNTVVGNITEKVHQARHKKCISGLAGRRPSFWEFAKDFGTAIEELTQAVEFPLFVRRSKIELRVVETCWLKSHLGAACPEHRFPCFLLRDGRDEVHLGLLPTLREVVMGNSNISEEEWNREWAELA